MEKIKHEVKLEFDKAAKLEGLDEPTQVDTYGFKLINLCAGFKHTVALFEGKEDNERMIFGCGSNQKGQLGNLEDNSLGFK